MFHRVHEIRTRASRLKRRPATLNTLHKISSKRSPKPHATTSHILKISHLIAPQTSCRDL